MTLERLAASPPLRYPTWTSILALGVVLSVALGSGVFLGGCKPLEAKTLHQSALVRIASPSGAPLAGVSVLVGGKRLATSGPDGNAVLRVEGHDGDAFRVAVECPDGFFAADPPSFDVLVRVPEEAAKVPRFESRCAPVSHRTTVSVRSNGPNLPVLHRGKEVARTNADGSATVTVDVPAGDELALVLDTRDARRLKPASPTFTLRPSAPGGSFVLEQTFTVEPARGTARRPR